MAWGRVGYRTDSELPAQAAYLEDAGEAARQLGIAASNWGDQQVKTTQGMTWD